MTPMRGSGDAALASRSQGARLRTSSSHGTPGSGGGPARGSAVWQFFSTSPEDVSVAVCNLCEQRLSRGRPGTHLGTSALIQHMRRHHTILWEMCSGQQRQALPPRHQSSFQSKTQRASSSSSSFAAAAHSAQTSPGQEDSAICCSDDEEGDTAGTKSKLDHSGSSAMHSQPHSHQQQEHNPSPPPPYSHQPSIVECLEQKHDANHPLVRQLNAHLARLLVMQSLPYQLVDSNSFQKLMECAQPRWKIPSSHYFSNKAIPALYAHVTKNVAHSLDFSLCSSVHTTAEIWSSSHSQEQYLAFTAHWVNLVTSSDNASCSQGQEVELVTPPRMARSSSETRRLSLSSISSSEDQSRSPTAKQPASTCLPPYHTCKMKRCRAILHLMSLGDRSHTAGELLACINQQIARWFSPHLLHVGNVVSDNSKSIATALRMGQLKNSPSFTHIVNSAVHSFLTNYPGLENVLGMARRVCSHFSRSYAAKNALLDLQRQNGLPFHKLICDVPMQWNSTLQMLDRLYEQRKAVDDYMMHRGTNAVNVCLFEPRQWQMIRDVCHLLKPFEEATRFVSRENCGLNDVIPLIFILEKALTLMQQGKEEEEDEVKDLTGCRVSVGVTFGGGSAQEEMEDDEEGQHFIHSKSEEKIRPSIPLKEGEEEAMSLPVGDEADHLSSRCASSDHDDNHNEEFQWGVGNDSTMGSETLAGMASYMLTCLQSDMHITDIKLRDDYWVATLLDPRYKSKMGKFFEASERETKLRHYQSTLCSLLAAAFTEQTPISPPPEDEAPLRSPLPHQSNTFTKTSSTSSIHYSLFDMMENFFQPPPYTEPSNQRYKQHFEKMVTSYLDCSLVPDNLSYDPMNYWVCKLDQWPELAQFAIQLLTCPPSSVLSERVFREVGGVIHPKCTKLSAARVERLTFIKMNESWISDNFLPPPPDTTE
ncbi:zinc finger BED domain-containing protein 6-like [Rana temporaria]|uniref:zinc finger BED domain-containing protein 6-like n=1 Tax=Rana temporaria TaxID=8407 RepID=UPI001AAD24DD|nr:zinc finger BED domain-containing protein 6-like [Rana temporaria]